MRQVRSRDRAAGRQFYSVPLITSRERRRHPDPKPHLWVSRESGLWLCRIRDQITEETVPWMWYQTTGHGLTMEEAYRKWRSLMLERNL
jgi:hypothetical protein